MTCSYERSTGFRANRIGWSPANFRSGLRNLISSIARGRRRRSRSRRRRRNLQICC